VSVAWLPAVIIAGWPGTGRCLSRHRPRPGRAVPKR
jgi:hypothetical protein